MASDSIKQKAIKGTKWSVIDNIASHAVPFLVGIILARILTPEEYGLMAIIMIFIAVFNSIVDSGFSSALVRKNNATERDYNTIFWFNLGISGLFFVILYFIAPFISQFFNKPELTNITRVMGVVILINGFAIIQRTLLTKSIDFKTQTKVSIISTATSGCVGISMAYCEYGVWSLVGQQITKQLLNTLLLWVFSKWRPKLQFSNSSFVELFSFGWKLLVSGLIDTIWRQIYQVVIGRFYSPEVLGQYGRADHFRALFSNNLSYVIQRVSYPVLCSIQDDNERLKQGYKKIITLTMYISFICMLGLASVAKPMILTLIGDKWLPSVEYLQIICFSGMLYPLHAINLNMLQVQGRSDLFLRLEIIKKIIAIAPILLGIFIDIYWMLIGGVITNFFAYYLNSYYSGKMLKYSMGEQLRDILPSFVIALFMSSCVYYVSFLDLKPLLLLIVQLIVGVLLTITLSSIFKIRAYSELKSILLTSIKKRNER